MDTCAEATGGQTEQATARADVQETMAIETRELEHGLQRPLGLHDPLRVESGEEPTPVLAEWEALAALDLQ